MASALLLLPVAGAAPAAASSSPHGASPDSCLPYPECIGSPSALSEGQVLYQGEELQSPNGSYQLVMQTDGNLVLYYGGSTALWQSHTQSSDDYATLQTDGNMVIYNSSRAVLWHSHTGGGYSSAVLQVQDDGNVVIYNNNVPLWSTATPAGGRNCWVSDYCDRNFFAWTFLGIPPQSPYYGADGPLVFVNNNAVHIWENAENTTAQCNPLATTQHEPGSYQFNSADVQNYQDYDGHTCWYWGIVATGQTILDGYYGNVLSVLRNASQINGTYNQCVALAHAVGNSMWGTYDFSADC